VAILGVDVGRTFTDAVLLVGDELRTAKVQTARRHEESVLASDAPLVTQYRRSKQERAQVEADFKEPRALSGWM
jgi:N-methylhydantoinase A/oxoprolinase/acetone carboxylase beta subunit